jgi:hypothetical protein
MTGTPRDDEGTAMTDAQRAVLNNRNANIPILGKDAAGH